MTKYTRYNENTPKKLSHIGGSIAMKPMLLLLNGSQQNGVDSNKFKAVGKADTCKI